MRPPEEPGLRSLHRPRPDAGALPEPDRPVPRAHGDSPARPHEHRCHAGRRQRARGEAGCRHGAGGAGHGVDRTDDRQVHGRGLPEHVRLRDPDHEAPACRRPLGHRAHHQVLGAVAASGQLLRAQRLGRPPQDRQHLGAGQPVQQRPRAPVEHGRLLGRPRALCAGQAHVGAGRALPRSRYREPGYGLPAGGDARRADAVRLRHALQRTLWPARSSWLAANGERCGGYRGRPRWST